MLQCYCNSKLLLHKTTLCNNICNTTCSVVEQYWSLQSEYVIPVRLRAPGKLCLQYHNHYPIIIPPGASSPDYALIQPDSYYFPIVHCGLTIDRVSVSSLSTVRIEELAMPWTRRHECALRRYVSDIWGSLHGTQLFTDLSMQQLLIQACPPSTICPW